MCRAIGETVAIAAARRRYPSASAGVPRETVSSASRCHGSAPERLDATGRAFPGRSRPLCAYPQHAHYKGTGDTQDARNFECRQ